MEEKNIDVFIAGAGAAGLTAAIYASRAGLSTVVCDPSFEGGNMVYADRIENYPSYSDVDGVTLAQKMKEQAEKSGADIRVNKPVTHFKLSQKVKVIETEDIVYYAKTVIIATGAKALKLNIRNEEEFSGHGIHYCATCDGAFYKNKVVAVIGGGNSAVSAGIYLSSVASKVIMIRRGNDFNCERILAERMKAIKNIQILYNWDLADVIGEGRVIAAVIKNTKNNTQSIIPVDGIFVCIGYTPSTEMFKDTIELDDKGYIITDSRLMTNIPGVLAAGDVRSGAFRQIITAASDGAVAAMYAEKIINGKLDK